MQRLMMMMMITAALGLASSLTAATICPFECLSPGASNQSICAPVAEHIVAHWDEPSQVITVVLDSYNGIYLDSIEIQYAVSMTGVYNVYVHSNGGTWSETLPEFPRRITITSVGIGGPDHTTLFRSEGDCCDHNPVPEPGYTVWAGVGLLAIGLWLRRCRG